MSEKVSRIIHFVGDNIFFETNADGTFVDAGNDLDRAFAENPPAAYSWQQKEVPFVRALDPELDNSLFDEAWRWQNDKPQWWRDSTAVFRGNKEEFFANTKRDCQVDFGIFSEGGAQLFGLLTVIEIKPNVFEAHSDARRGADLDFITTGVKIARDHCFQNGATRFISFVASFNRPVLKMCRAVGYRETGARLLHSADRRGRIIEWIELELVKPQFGPSILSRRLALQLQLNEIYKANLLPPPLGFNIPNIENAKSSDFYDGDGYRANMTAAFMKIEQALATARIQRAFYEALNEKECGAPPETNSSD
jgi:hypothetical protein